MSLDLASLSLFAAALMVAAGAPGPSVVALVCRVIAAGWRDVLPFLAAMWIGEILWLLAAVFGLGALAEAFHEAFLVLKWAGIAYLVWLAWGMWRAEPGGAAAALPSARAPRRMFMAGMAVTLGNPKIMVFYLALLPNLVPVGALTGSDAAALAATALLVLAAVDLAWVAVAGRARRLLRSPRAVRIANRVGAGLLGGAAGAMAAN